VKKSGKSGVERFVQCNNEFLSGTTRSRLVVQILAALFAVQKSICGPGLNLRDKSCKSGAVLFVVDVSLFSVQHTIFGAGLLVKDFGHGKAIVD
jgi:hypothetical protein